MTLMEAICAATVGAVMYHSPITML